MPPPSLGTHLQQFMSGLEFRPSGRASSGGGQRGGFAYGGGRIGRSRRPDQDGEFEDVDLNEEKEDADVDMADGDDNRKRAAEGKDDLGIIVDKDTLMR